MELRHLRYFVAVAEELHFGRAAQRLKIAQPSLSQQIHGLEAELGVDLFSRNRRRVELTPAGSVFLPEGRAILAHADRAVDLARRAARGQVGQLRVGFIGSATYDDFVPSILRAYRDIRPEVELVLEEMSTTQQVDRLRDRTLDVGFARPPVGDDSIAAVPVRTERLYAALPSRHPLAGQSAVALAALAQDAFVMLPRKLNLGLYDQVVSLCRAAGFAPRVVQEAAEMHTIVSLVAAGIGVSVVPDSARNLRAGSVAYVPFRNPDASTEMVVTYRHGDGNPVLRAFLDTVCRHRDQGETLTG